MRRIRIAAFAAASVLLCVALWRMIAIDPAPADNNADFDSQASPVNVPPPPPEAVEQPAAKKRAVRTRVAEVRSTAEGPSILAEASDEVDLNPSDPAPVSDAAPVVTASAEQPAGPVIVVPQERPKQPSRGMRWLKGVGRVLGIGGKKDPAEQAFQN